MKKQRTAETDSFLRRFATMWSICSIVYIFSISFIHIPQENIRFVDLVLGFLLGTIISAIIQFFFGSSIGSKEKDNSPHPPVGDQNDSNP